MPKNFDMRLGMDVGGALSASDRLIAKQKQVADAAQAAANAQQQAAAQSAARMTALYTVMAQKAIQLAQDVAGSWAKAVESTVAKQQANADKFSGTRTSLRELATLQGRTLDNNFIREFAAGNVRTRMTAQESIGYQSQFLNSGNQYIDKGDGQGGNMLLKDATKYKEQAALLATSRGLEGKIAGDLAGRTLGYRNYKGMADPGGQALASIQGVFGILDQGVGEAPQLAEQFNMAMAASGDASGANRGAFKHEFEAAAAISVASQKVPGRAFTGTEAALKQLRNFGNPLIQAAGVTSDDSLKEALIKIAPIVNARAKKYGMKPIDVLRKGSGEVGEMGFEDDLGAQMIDTFLKEGLTPEQGGVGGLFDKRERIGREMGRVGVAEGNIEKYKTSDEGIAAGRRAQGEYVDATRGIETSKPMIMFQEAAMRLRAANKLDTSESDFKNFLSGTLSMGMLGDLDQKKIRTQARGFLNARLPKGVTPVDVEGEWTPEEEIKEMNRAINESAAKGVNVLLSNEERKAAEMPKAIPSGPDPEFDGRN